MSVSFTAGCHDCRVRYHVAANLMHYAKWREDIPPASRGQLVLLITFLLAHQEHRVTLAGDGWLIEYEDLSDTDVLRSYIGAKRRTPSGITNPVAIVSHDCKVRLDLQEPLSLWVDKRCNVDASSDKNMSLLVAFLITHWHEELSLSSDHNTLASYRGLTDEEVMQGYMAWEKADSYDEPALDYRLYGARLTFLSSPTLSEYVPLNIEELPSVNEASPWNSPAFRHELQLATTFMRAHSEEELLVGVNNPLPHWRKPTLVELKGRIGGEGDPTAKRLADFSADWLSRIRLFVRETHHNRYIPLTIHLGDLDPENDALWNSVAIRREIQLMVAFLLADLGPIELTADIDVPNSMLSYTLRELIYRIVHPRTDPAS